MSTELRDEVEASIGCATISLAAIAAVTSPWAREQTEDEFDADMFTELIGTLRELRTFFLSLNADLESGTVRDQWTKAAGEYGKLGFEEVTSLSRFEDLKSRYEIWRLDEKSALQRELKKLGLHEAADPGDGVLRVCAPMPNSMHRREHLGKLLYLVNEGVDRRAAVVWEDSENTGTIRKLALVFDLEQMAVLEVTRFYNSNFLFWRCCARSGSPTDGMHLTPPIRTIPSEQVSLPDRSSPDARLIDQAKEFVPDLFE